MCRFLVPQVKKMPCMEGLFVLMPLMHSEDMMDVDYFCRELKGLATHVKAVSSGKRHASIVLEQHLAIGEEHLSVVSNFGRYPQRNEALGRESTPDELQWLKSKAAAKLEY